MEVGTSQQAGAVVHVEPVGLKCGNVLSFALKELVLSVGIVSSTNNMSCVMLNARLFIFHSVITSTDDL